jgi:hypothetical protein
MKSLRLCLLVLSFTTLASAGDNEFRGVVHAIEGHYGVRHMHIPLLGFAMWFARPEGVSGMKLAVFENFSGSTDADDVSRIVEDALGHEWYPFVRVRSRNRVKGDDEATLIYASPSGGKLRMMIVNVESTEATVVEVKLSDRAIRQWLKEPGEEAEGHAGPLRHRDAD